MRKVRTACPESLAPLLCPLPNFILFNILLVCQGWMVEQGEGSQSLIGKKP